MKVIINLKGYGTCRGKGRHAGFRKGVGTAARGKKDIIR